MQGYEALTDREKQTLRLLLEGHDAKSIARHFGLSVHTIYERLRDARRKLSVSSSREAARLLREIEGADPQLLGDIPLGGAVPQTVAQPHNPSHTPHPPWQAKWAIGAMVMLTLFAAILALSGPSLTPAQSSEAASIAESDASRAARSWLALVDAGKWQESYDAAGHSFKSLNPVRGWRWSSEKVRVPLGAVLTRTLISEDVTPAPPHGYRVVRFRTVFANRTAIETVSLDCERKGWKVVGITAK